MKLLFFGITKDIVGQRELSDIILNKGNTVSDLLAQLKKDHPGLDKVKSLAVGVNQQYATADTALNEDDVVALIPPVSGG